MSLPSLPPASTLSPEAALDELGAYLRPPGQGIHTVSTGRAELLAKTRRYLGDSYDPDAPWRDHLRGIVDAEPSVALLAIPSDTGAGIVRGAARGPEAIREALGTAPVFDLGDVFCIPHLLDEEMLSDAQRIRSQDVLHPNAEEATRRAMPISPLGMAIRVYELLGTIRPDLRIMMLGGDHTVTWAPMAHLLAGGPAANADVGIVHFDAHTDLLAERLGVRYCFATWAFHANELLGGGERLLQLGIRASGHERGHWEQSQGVRQIWADEARAQSPEWLAREVVTHLERRGCTRVYVTNDIDGTDAHWAGACGTPEPDGLSPEAVLAVLDALRTGPFEILGADLVEVAPGLSLDPEASARTVETAARYTHASLALFDTRE